MLSGEVHPRGPQYIHKDEAVANLLKEVQNYLLTYKRIENHKIVAKMNQDHIDPDIVWYIERPDDREYEITLYRVIDDIVPGWWGQNIVKKIERHMIFGVMDLPNRPINIPTSRHSEKTYIVPDLPGSKSTFSQDELMSVLRKAVEKRKEKLDERERMQNMTPLQRAVEKRRKVIESQENEEEWQ